MELKQLNEILKNISSPNPKLLKYVEKQDISTPINFKYGDGLQGESNTFCRVYKILSEVDLYLKVNYYTDSYGRGEYINGIEFVKVAQKQVTVYEPI